MLNLGYNGSKFEKATVAVIITCAMVNIETTKSHSLNIKVSLITSVEGCQNILKFRKSYCCS